MQGFFSCLGDSVRNHLRIFLFTKDGSGGIPEGRNRWVIHPALLTCFHCNNPGSDSGYSMTGE